ncbi:WD40 repeat-like protein [Russula ochroleuca]|jgi:WD40 repeat protein|uniref:WD40 repeat-like protein n=1 Tax=Russula ochroleuca TaxID=152965 RepID=A0A9P5N4B5_9AGAM|nr:WD40 repeat-like protein [Russula ochroleuca]
MATTDQPAHEAEQDEEEFLEQDDIFVEIDQGDEPMDEDDDAGGIEGEVVWEDNSIQHFSGHEGPVYTVSAHPTTPLAVSGGGDDAGYIWDVTDGEIIVKLTGHTDSVSAVGFSSDGDMVSTGGMDGKVRVWRRVGKEDYKTWEFLTELQGPDEVIWLRWHPKGPVLVAGSNDSTVWLWQLPSGNTMQVFAGHTGSVQCGEFTPDGKRIVTACADNTFIYWDPRSPTPLFKLTGNNARFDLGGITSLAVNPASTIAVIGGAEGGVRVVSLSKGEVISALGGHTDGESVEAVAFVNIVAAVDGTSAPVGSASANTVVTGATDGKVCIWDLKTNRLRTTLEHKDAVTGLLVHPTKPHFVISSSADHTLRTWDARAGALVREHKGHQEPINGAALGQGGEIVVSASDDGACLVFGTE